MGWKDILAYTRSIAASKGLVTSTRADDALPLGARIGSVVRMQLSPVIRAQAGGSLIVMPADADTRVLAVSQIKLAPAAALYRLYLVTGDEQADEKFLQVYSNDDGSVAEILYCTQLARVVPESAEDQDAYTGLAGHGLGDASYSLWREQLADMLDAATLAAAFGENERIDYARDAGSRELDFVKPFTGQEIRIDDVEGIKGLKQQMYYMPYVRELAGGGREYLLITTEIIDSVDGDSSRRGIHVDFVIGIPMEQERITVQ